MLNHSYMNNLDINRLVDNDAINVQCNIYLNYN